MRPLNYELSNNCIIFLLVCLLISLYFVSFKLMGLSTNLWWVEWMIARGIVWSRAGVGLLPVLVAPIPIHHTHDGISWTAAWIIFTWETSYNAFYYLTYITYFRDHSWTVRIINTVKIEIENVWNNSVMTQSTRQTTYKEKAGLYSNFMTSFF